MCLIIVNPKGAGELDFKTFTEADSENPDGAGLMYSSRGKLYVHKPFFKSDKFYECYQNALLERERGPIVMHWRWKTHGKVDCRNTHPHYACKHRVGVVHNGILPCENYADESDTLQWIRTVLYGRQASQVMSEEFCNHIENYIGSSRIVFLDSTGECRILNETCGEWHQKNWYSNNGLWAPKITCKEDWPTGFVVKGRDREESDYAKGWSNVEWWKKYTDTEETPAP